MPSMWTLISLSTQAISIAPPPIAISSTTSLYLSSRNLKVQPSADTTTNTVIYDADGNALVTVDSNNDLVKLGKTKLKRNKISYLYLDKNGKIKKSKKGKYAVLA